MNVIWHHDAYWFWARPHTIGSTDAEIDRFADHDLSEERMQAISWNTMCAARHLITTSCEGRG